MRVGPQSSKSEPEPPSPAEESCGKKKHAIKMTSTRGGIAKASQPRALREPRVPHRWYRRSVPNCGTTRNHPAPGGWVGAVFLGPPLTLNTHLVPPGGCSAWPLLAVWDSRFSRAHRQPTTHIWSLLECAAHGRSSQCGTRGFLGFTANPHLQKLPQHNAGAGSRSNS